MAQRYILSKTGEHEWSLSRMGAARALKTFETKAEGMDFIQSMTSARSVVIRNSDSGRFMEERTYPRSVDPRRFPG